MGLSVNSKLQISFVISRRAPQNLRFAPLANEKVLHSVACKRKTVLFSPAYKEFMGTPPVALPGFDSSRQ